MSWWKRLIQGRARPARGGEVLPGRPESDDGPLRLGSGYGMCPYCEWRYYGPEIDYPRALAEHRADEHTERGEADD